VWPVSQKLLDHFPTNAIQAAVLCDLTYIFVSQRPPVVSRKVAECLRFDCGQYGTFTVFAAYRLYARTVCDTKAHLQLRHAACGAI